MPYATLTLELRPPLAELRLSAGALADARFRAELIAATSSLHDNAAITVVLLTGDGGAFAAEAAPPGAGDAFRCVELMAQPVVAAVEDAATGAGLELLLACDIRIAGESATFAMQQVAHGEIPSEGGTQRLPRLIGRTKAAEMILLGEPLGAAAALACGLVNAVAPAGGARAQAEQLAVTIASRGPLAVRYAKEAMQRGMDMPLEQALRYETDLTVILQTTADREEGVRAFLEKRKPRFTGE